METERQNLPTLFNNQRFRAYAGDKAETFQKYL